MTNEIEWWCGNNSETTPCQTGINASFVSYTGGYILGFPPVTYSPSVPTKSPSNLVTTTFSVETSSKSTIVPESPLANTSTGPPVPAQTQEHSTSPLIAIGVGIGIPLGIAAIGFLVFLFWKEALRQRRSKPRILSQDIGLNSGGHFAATAIEGQWTELPDAQLPRELYGRGGTEPLGI